MSDWLGEIKNRMKGPMISASMTNRVRHDMERLISEAERLREALKKHGVHSTECFRTHSHELTISELPSTYPYQKEVTFPAGEINCSCGLEKALAAAQEDE